MIGAFTYPAAFPARIPGTRRLFISYHSDNKFLNGLDVAHVNATHTGIERERPAHGSVCLLLRSHGACEVLVEERRDDERMIRKPRFRDHAINLRLASRVRHIEPAAADRFYIRQR